MFLSCLIARLIVIKFNLKSIQFRIINPRFISAPYRRPT